MKKTYRKRSGPVYVKTESGTISLVFEAEVREVVDGSGGRVVEVVGKPDVYVIDGDGVRLLRREGRLLRAIIVGVVIFALSWAVSRLLGGR